MLIRSIIRGSLILACLNILCFFNDDSNFMIMEIAQAIAEEHRGEFTITAAQRTLGKESFYKQTDGSHVILKGHVYLQNIHGKPTETVNIGSELTLDQRHHPQTYNLIISKGQYKKTLDIKFAKGKAFYKSEENRKTKTGALELSANSVVLENNQFHHYTTLIERYRFDQGGLQRFDVFVPSQLLKTFVELTLSKTIGEKRKKEVTYSISVNFGDLVSLIIDLDSNKKITKIEIPLQEVVVTQAERSSEVAFNQYSSKGHRVVDQPITISVPQGKITGSLSIPIHCHNSLPAIVLVSGSGIQSKDGPLGLYRQIGFHLSELGFAVLRFDDSGAGETRLEDQGIFTTEIVAVRAAIEYVRSRPEVDSGKIILLGHSAGGIIASHIVVHDKELQALVLLAMPAIPLFELLNEQMSKIKEKEARKLFKRQIATTKKHLDSPKSVIETGHSTIRVSELRKYFYENPQEILSMVKIPVLVVQGDNDEKVPKKHAYRLKDGLLSGHSKNSFRIFKGLNHFFFKSVESSHEVDQGAMSFVGHWITNSLSIDVCQKEVSHGK